MIRRRVSPQSFVSSAGPAFFTAIMFIGGIQLTAIGIIGEYVGKIYQEVQKRPKYIIKEKRNL